MKTAIASAVVLLAIVAFFGPKKMWIWLGIIEENVASQIDKALGEVRVKRDTIADDIASREQAAAKLTEGKIKSRIKAERQAEHLKAVEDKQVKARASMSKLRDLIQAGEPATLGGKTYTVAELEAMAERVIGEFKSIESQAQSMRKTHDILRQMAEQFERRAAQEEGEIRQMNNKLVEIDAKILGMEHMKEASQIAGIDPKSFAKQKDELWKDIHELEDIVDFENTNEHEKWDKSDDVDVIIEATSGTGSTVDKLNDLVGEPKQ